MRAVHAPFLVLVALALFVLGAACAEPEIIVTHTELVLELSDDPACRPPSTPTPTWFTVTSVGDYPLTEGAVQDFPVGGGEPIPALNGLPFATRALYLSFTNMERSSPLAAIHFVVDEDGTRHALMLPLGMSCASTDPDAAAPIGAVVAGLPRGGFLIAGGQRATTGATRRAVVVPADGTLGLVTDGLAIPRIGATATLSDDRILIAGGASLDSESAEDTFEVFDVTTQQLEAARPMCRGEGASCRRRDHGAVTMASGWVLITGGVSRAGDAPLDTTVALDPFTGAVDATYGPLPRARRSPQMVKLDDGTILVVGGYVRPDSGDPDAVVGAVYFLDATQRTFEEIEGVDTVTGVPLPSREGAVAIPLPGRRLAWIGGRGSGGSVGPSETAVTVLSFAFGPRNVERITIPLPDPWVPLTAAHAVARADGRIFVVGTDELENQRSFIVDVGRGEVEEVAQPRLAITHLAVLGDGVIAEIGPDGTSYRRDLLRTAYDSPPATLVPEDVEWIAPDVADHFMPSATRTGLTASADYARIEVPTLRFSDVDVSPTVDGSYELLLTTDSGIQGAVEVTVDGVDGTAEARIGTCHIDYTAGTRLTAERRGEVVTLGAGTTTEACPLDGLVGPIRLSVRLRFGATFRSIAIQRL